MHEDWDTLIKQSQPTCSGCSIRVSQSFCTIFVWCYIPCEFNCDTARKSCELFWKNTLLFQNYSWLQLFQKLFWHNVHMPKGEPRKNSKKAGFGIIRKQILYWITYPKSFKICYGKKVIHVFVIYILLIVVWKL